MRAETRVFGWSSRVVSWGVIWLLSTVVWGGIGVPRAVAQEPITAWDRDDPQRDGWSTEVLQEMAGQQWKSLAALVGSGKSIASPQFARIVSDEFNCSPLRPARLKTVFRDQSIAVYRPAETLDTIRVADSANDAGVAGFERAIQKMLEWAENSPSPGQPASERRLFVKIFRVEPRPRGAETMQLVSFFAEYPHGSREVHAVWRADWEVAETDQPPRLLAIRLEEFEETITNAPRATWLSECSEGLLGSNASYREHLLLGLEHWNHRYAQVGTDGMFGCAVADINSDGLEDLFLCQGYPLPNRLYVQNPDGTATDRSAEAGIDFHETTHAALFLDLDQDGDQDLVLAMSATLLLLENDGQGHFERRAALREPRDAYSLSAADFDLDGDVDLYACVYLPKVLRRQILSAPVPIQDARNGGRNVLLRNDGDWQFRDVNREQGLESESGRRSFACTWEDYDNDGDPDLYVANDYGPNNLFRNDRGRFVDVAREAGVQDQSFGMSASWGDTNRDGHMDLYVCNMFSAAGNRIAYQRQFREDDDESVRRQFQYMARGNSLFQNMGDGQFRDVSERSGVMIGLWSWGSLLVDLNNDGYDEVLIANGYLTRSNPDDL